MSKKILEETAQIYAYVNEIKANEELGVTQDYNRENRQKLWDSTKAKREFKKQTFGDGNTYYDPISGNTLNRSHKAAQNKYHMKNAEGDNSSTAWAGHAPETDHIIALKDIHDRVKGNAFLTDNDIKEMANHKNNYRVLAKSMNASKGEQSDYRLALDPNSGLSVEARKTLIMERTNAEIHLSTEIAQRTIKNASKEFGEGAKETLAASVVPLTAEAVRRMCNVASGEESLEEAVVGFGKTTIDIAVVGGSKRIVTDIVAGTLNNSNSAFLRNIASSNQVSQFVSVAIIVAESAERYLNGELTGEEFIEEIGTKGTMMVAGMIGGAIGQELGGMIGGMIGAVILPGVGAIAGDVVGEVVGQILGTVLVTVACGAIIAIKDSWKHLDDYKKKERLLKQIESDALAEMGYQRNNFKNLVQQEFAYWDSEIEQGFDMIITNACEGVYDAAGVAEGLDKILKLFGSEVRFHNLDEYEGQLDMPLQLSF